MGGALTAHWASFRAERIALLDGGFPGVVFTMDVGCGSSATSSCLLPAPTYLSATKSPWLLSGRAAIVVTSACEQHDACWHVLHRHALWQCSAAVVGINRA